MDITLNIDNLKVREVKVQRSKPEKTKLLLVVEDDGVVLKVLAEFIDTPEEPAASRARWVTRLLGRNGDVPARTGLGAGIED